MIKTVHLGKGKEAEFLTDSFITGADRMSIPKITKFEETSIISFRAEQLSNNVPSYLTEIPEDIRNDMIKIAELEYSEHLINCKILRPIIKDGKQKYEIITIGKESDVYIFPKV